MPERYPEHFDFASFFSAKLKERGLTFPKLSQLSGISVQDLKNLSEGDFDELPPAPYLRGYTARLAKILEFDPEIWWKHFEDIGAVRRSGAADTLPQNRFEIPRAMRYRWIVALALLALLYGGLRFSQILGRPVITVAEPAANHAETSVSSVVFRGTFENGDQLFINDERVQIADGRFEKTVPLDEGVNTVRIRASKLLGKNVELQYQVVYNPPAPATSTAPAALE